MKIHEFLQPPPARRATALVALRNLWQGGRALWTQFVQAHKRRPRSLRLCESLSLGDRRFIAVVAYEQSHFLVGGTSGSLVLLTRLGKNPENADASEPGLRSDFSQEPLG